MTGNAVTYLRCMLRMLSFQLLGCIAVPTFKATTTSEVNLSSWELIRGCKVTWEPAQLGELESFVVSSLGMVTGAVSALGVGACVPEARSGTWRPRVPLVISEVRATPAQLPSCLPGLTLFPSSPQVCPAGPPQGLRGGTQAQLLPRGRGAALGLLLRELHWLRAELHQRVERHAGPGVHEARLPRPVRGQVSASAAPLPRSPAPSLPPDPESAQRHSPIVSQNQHPAQGFLTCSPWVSLAGEGSDHRPPPHLLK